MRIFFYYWDQWYWQNHKWDKISLNITRTLSSRSLSFLFLPSKCWAAFFLSFFLFFFFWNKLSVDLIHSHSHILGTLHTPWSWQKYCLNIDYCSYSTTEFGVYILGYIHSFSSVFFFNSRNLSMPGVHTFFLIHVHRNHGFLIRCTAISHVLIKKKVFPTFLIRCRLSLVAPAVTHHVAPQGRK